VNVLLQHLPVLPVVVPLVTGAVMLLVRERRRRTHGALAITSFTIQLAAAVVLLLLTTDTVRDVWTEGIGVYRIGGWPAPFAIVLVVDRLAAMMVMLSATLGLAAILYSVAHWDRPALPFHALLQFLAMGVNGAFLTGDLFNLYVFFEVLLAASYGLVLRGLGSQRVKTGLNYIAINLASSSLFLIGVALIYGISGTLNMADLTQKVAALEPDDRTILEAGAAVLGVAFLVKAGSWPLNFWLPRTYAIALPPVAAIFAILSKVGIYAVIRVSSLTAGDNITTTILDEILFWVGLGTLLAGIVGMLSARHLSRFIAYSVVISTGLVLGALGLGIETLIAPVLFYIGLSVVTTGTFFMLTGMAERARETIVARNAAELTAPAPFFVAYGVADPDPYGIDEEIGTAIPAAMAFLGLIFVFCVMLVAGLPPLPGFVAKFAILAAVLGSPEVAAAPAWLFASAVLLSGLATVITTSRIGIRLFWTSAARRVPRLRLLEAAPVALLLLAMFAATAAAPVVMEFLDATAASLQDPQAYVRAVLGGEP